MDKNLVRPKVNKILITAAVFIFINIIISVWLTYEFYVQSANSVCSINAMFDCITVAQSEYAVMFGVPVAVLGVLFYTGLFAGVLGVVLRVPFHRILKFLRPGTVLAIVRFAAYFGLLYAFYLTYVEAFKIHVYCPFCLAQQVFIIVIVVLLVWADLAIKKGLEETKVCEFC